MFVGLVTAWRLAGAPTRISSLAYATILGVVRAPSEFSITLGLPFSITATHELVVPRSIPMILAIFFSYKQMGFCTVPTRATVQKYLSLVYRRSIDYAIGFGLIEREG